MTHGARHGSPVIDAERCVHAHAAQASCCRCASACPHDALRLTDQSLEFDEAACTGCGHCRPACPETAIAFPGISLEPVVDKEAGEVYLACSATIPEGGPGTLPCLHIMGERDLSQMASDGVSQLRVARGACADCMQRAAATIEDHLFAVNRLLISRGQVQIELVDETPPSWRQRVASTSAQGRALNASRRALFSGLFPKPAGRSQNTDSSAMLARFAPLIEAAACSGCDACARICPHGAILLMYDEAGLRYATKPHACTGCGLCTDLCDHDAIRIEAFAPAGAMRLALTEGRCTRCGAPFHEPEPDTNGPKAQELCRICRTHRHPTKLFEVRG